MTTPKFKQQFHQLNAQRDRLADAATPRVSAAFDQEFEQVALVWPDWEQAIDPRFWYVILWPTWVRSASLWYSQQVKADVMPPHLLRRLIDMVEREARAIADSTTDQIAARVALSLIARRAGLEDVEELYAGWAAGRARRIALNEVLSATATGRHFGGEAEGRAKWWQTRGDDKVRRTHVAAGITYSAGNPIGYNELFYVGDSAMLYPHDPAGSAAETQNCRCLEQQV